MIYLTILSELDYIRPLIFPSMVPSVITSTDYKNTASDASYLQPSSSPSLEELVIPSIVISIRPSKSTSLNPSVIHSDIPSGMY